MREAIVRQINANSDVHNMNVTAQARYRRWAYGSGPFVRSGNLQRHGDLLQRPRNRRDRGSRHARAAYASTQAAGAYDGSYPQVTFDSGGTEAPDETAQGDWLNLVSKAGFYS